MGKEAQIQIDQTLHGYSDGHRLLTSSRKLSRTTERTMLVLSDMSGPSMAPGFDNYLTGYPLPGEETYAFARTWYAPEMQRPGCVWTHTLLITNKHFRKLPDLSVVCKFFHRPPERLRKHVYEEPIPLNVCADVDQRPRGGISDFHEAAGKAASLGGFVEHIVFSLYGAPDCSSVLLVAPRSTIYEELVLKLWSQQWPQLRCTFAFCTGSLSNRSINGRQFDLQVIPAKAVRQFEREVPDAQILSFEEAQRALSQSEWVLIAAHDLLHDHAQELREYLWEVADASNGNRRSFAPLVRTYECLRATNANQMTIGHLMLELEKLYPGPEEGIGVKTRVFGPPGKNRQSLLTAIDEPELLRNLAVTRYHSIFTPGMLEIRSRARSLWGDRNSRFRDVIVGLVGTDINPLGEEILIGVSEVIQPDELLELSTGNKALVFVFVERRPELASHRSLWVGAADYQRELFDHVARGSPTEETIKSIVYAILDSRADSVAADVYKHFQEHVVSALLDWFDERISTGDTHLSSGWVQVIEMAPKDSLSWLSNTAKPKARTVALIASQLNPHSEIVKGFGTQIWLRLLDNIKHDLDYETHRRIAEFLLPFSFNKPGPGYEKLAHFSFKIIDEALANNDLSYNSWRLLEPVLPKLPWYRSWDKCERLRRGLRRMGLEIDGR